MNCHDLKDRVALEDWSGATVLPLWSALEQPLARILMAKLLRLVLIARAERDEARGQSEGMAA